MSTSKNIDRTNLLPKDALDLLVQGNQRFIKNEQQDKNLSEMRDALIDNQQPFAAILGCSDSRVAPELIFDQTLGDIFSVRLAGNVACRVIEIRSSISPHAIDDEGDVCALLRRRGRMMSLLSSLAIVSPRGLCLSVKTLITIASASVEALVTLFLATMSCREGCVVSSRPTRDPRW